MLMAASSNLPWFYGLDAGDMVVSPESMTMAELVAILYERELEVAMLNGYVPPGD